MRSKEFPYMKNLNKKTVVELVKKYECRIVEPAGSPVELCKGCGYAKSNCVCRFQTKKVTYDTKAITEPVTCDL